MTDERYIDEEMFDDAEIDFEDAEGAASFRTSNPTKTDSTNTLR